MAASIRNTPRSEILYDDSHIDQLADKLIGYNKGGEVKEKKSPSLRELIAKDEGIQSGVQAIKETLAPTTKTWPEAVTRVIPLAGEAWGLDDIKKELAAGNTKTALALGTLEAAGLGGYAGLIKPNLKKLAKLMTRDFRTLTDEEVAELRNAEIISRRKTITKELLGPDRQLKSVHETGKTGTPSASLSKRVRGQREAELFTEPNTTYGILTSDPYTTLKDKFSVNIPYGGNADPLEWTRNEKHLEYFKQLQRQNPDKYSAVAEVSGTWPSYGAYGIKVAPHVKDRTTISFGNLTDYLSFPQAITLPNVLKNPNPALRELAERYLDKYPKTNLVRDQFSTPTKADKDFWKWAELELPKNEYGRKTLLTKSPRELINLQEIGLLPEEIALLDKETISDILAGNSRNTEFIEAQIHGKITPEDVEKVYDYSFKPSSKLEKELKQYGIEYEPVDSPIKLPKGKLTLGELKQQLGKENLYSPYPEELDYLPVKIKGNYAEGGAVEEEEESITQRIPRYVRKSQYKAAGALGLGPEVEYATEIPERYFPANEQHMGRGDAMRHLLLQAQLQQKWGDLGAYLIGAGHELFSGGQSDAEAEQDEYNDKLGRQIGRESKDRAEATYKALRAVQTGKARVLTKKQREENRYAEGGLVYDESRIDELANQLLGM